MNGSGEALVQVPGDADQGRDRVRERERSLFDGEGRKGVGLLYMLCGVKHINNTVLYIHIRKAHNMDGMR